MSKGRFLNQKLGKRTTRKIALLKARIHVPAPSNITPFSRKRESIGSRTDNGPPLPRG